MLSERAKRLPLRTLEVLRREILYKLESGEVLPDDFRRYGDRWRVVYVAEVAEVDALIASRKEEM